MKAPKGCDEQCTALFLLQQQRFFFFKERNKLMSAVMKPRDNRTLFNFVDYLLCLLAAKQTLIHTNTCSHTPSLPPVYSNCYIGQGDRIFYPS